MKNIALAFVIGLALGATFGWFLKSARVIVQTEKVLVHEHDQAVKLEVQHEKLKQAGEQGIRRARATAGDCDRARGNDAILNTLAGH